MATSLATSEPKDHSRMVVSVRRVGEVDWCERGMILLFAILKL